VIDVAGGQVDSIFAVVSGVVPQVRGGKLKALGVSGTQRSALIADAPTIAESGYPGFNASFAYAVMAPAGTPDEVVRTLNREILAAMAQPDLVEKNRNWDYVATGLNPQQSAEWLADTRRKWAEVIRRNNITID
jgi:tripartite-type tricarboxylate transporter receptor subunit TctC